MKRGEWLTQKRQMSKNAKFIFILIVLSGMLFFFKLGSFSLYDAAETTYGEFTKQIRLTGDWITMHYNGEIIFDKPPLYFWLATLATYIFGFGEFAIRFWAALSGVFTVLVTYYLGKSFYNQRVGFFSAIIAMTSFQFLIQSRIAEIDILLVFFITLSFLFFWQGYHTKKPNFYWLFYAAMAFGTLTKGVIGAALPITAIFLFLLFRKEPNRIREMQILPGIVIYFLIASPWYIAEWYLHGQRFTDFVLGFLFLSRFKGVVAGHPGPWYYYFLALLLGFAPWSHFLPYSLWKTWKNKLNSPELLSLCYIIPVFIVFSIAKTKLPNYVLPLYPFLAIMVGKLWDDFLEAGQQSMRKGMAIANLIFAAIVVLIILGFTILGTSNYSGPYQQEIPKLLLLAGLLVAGSSISIISYLLGKYRFSFYSIPAMVFIIALVLTIQTLPTVEKYKGTKELAEKVPQNELIASYNVGNRPGVVFYNSKPIVFLETKEQVLDFLKQKKGYCFTTLAEYEDLKGIAQVLGKQGDLVVLF
jgi:4-amino-4-deoxy-L-arabinose transferase-like glycosyltransferase